MQHLELWRIPLGGGVTAAFHPLLESSRRADVTLTCNAATCRFRDIRGQNGKKSIWEVKNVTPEPFFGLDRRHT